MLSTNLVSPLLINCLAAMKEARVPFPDPHEGPFRPDTVSTALMRAASSFHAAGGRSALPGFHGRITEGVSPHQYPNDLPKNELFSLAVGNDDEGSAYFDRLALSLIAGVRVLIAYNEGRIETARLMPSQERALVLAGIAASLQEIGLTDRALTVFREAVQQGSKITRPDLRTRTLGMLRMTARSSGIEIEIPT